MLCDAFDHIKILPETCHLIDDVMFQLEFTRTSPMTVLVAFIAPCETSRLTLDHLVWVGRLELMLLLSRRWSRNAHSRQSPARTQLEQSDHTRKFTALEQLALRPPDFTALLPAAKSATQALSVGLPYRCPELVQSHVKLACAPLVS